MQQFDPVQSYMQGFQGGQQIQQTKRQNELDQLSDALAGQMTQPGFDPAQSLELQQLSALDPTGAAKTLATFQGLDEARQKAFFKDARKGAQLLERGDNEGFLELAQERLRLINNLGGNPSDVMSVLQAYQSGDHSGALAQLKQAERVGVAGGYLIDTAQTGKREPKLGTYEPGNYTVRSWAEFAKFGDPSVLVRYSDPTRQRKLEIQEEVLTLKQEKAELDKQKAELDANKKEHEAAIAKGDMDKANYLQVQESIGTLNNINTLLDSEKSDLDLIYGGFEWMVPDKFRKQRGKNMMSRRDQVSASLELMAAGKMKGQGPITEGERAMLANVASLLKKETISPDLAREELNRIRPIVEFFVSGNRQGGPSISGENNPTEIDRSLLEFMSPEERALFNGS